MSGTFKMKKGKSCCRLLVAVCVVFVMIVSVMAPVFAHNPGGPRLKEVNLDPLIIRDGENTIELNLETFSRYYSGRTEETSRKGLFTIVSYRALQRAFERLWGDDEIPHRGDIQITSRLPIQDSVYFFEMITGTGPNQEGVAEKGEFELLIEDETYVGDLSPQNIKRLSRDITEDAFEFKITRKSTGEHIDIKVKEDVFSEGFLNLWKKAYFSMPDPITREEQNQYLFISYKMVDKLIGMDESMIFKGIIPPVPLSAVVFIGCIIIGVICEVALKVKNNFTRKALATSKG